MKPIRVLMIGLVPFQVKEETPEPMLPTLPCEDTAGRQLSLRQEKGSHQESNLLTPWSWISQPSRIVRNNWCISSPVWYFVTAAWAAPYVCTHWLTMNGWAIVSEEWKCKWRALWLFSNSGQKCFCSVLLVYPENKAVYILWNTEL